MAGLAAIIVLSYLSALAVDSIYGLGGRREANQRLNPLFVRHYDTVPDDAKPYARIHVERLFGTVIFVLQNDVLRLESDPKTVTPIVEYEFLGSLPSAGPIELFVERRSVRGILEILETPSASNEFTSRIRIVDPYKVEIEGTYDFDVLSRQIP